MVMHGEPVGRGGEQRFRRGLDAERWPSGANEGRGRSRGFRRRNGEAREIVFRLGGQAVARVWGVPPSPHPQTQAIWEPALWPR